MATATLGDFERTEGLDMVRVRARDLRAYAAFTSAGTGGEQPLTVGEARDRLRAGAPAPYGMLNGSMFGVCAPGDYATTTCEHLGYRLLDRNTGIDIPASATNVGRGSTIAVVNGRLVGVVGGREPALATVAIQGYPTVIQATRNVITDPPPVLEWRETTWRAGLAILDQEWCAFVVGRMSMLDFGVRLERIGAKWALYGDGGGSARLLNRSGAYKGSTENRRVPSMWYASGGPAGAGGVVVRGPNGEALDPMPPPPSSGDGKVVGAALLLGGLWAGVHIVRKML
jgi:hypothetical protein